MNIESPLYGQQDDVTERLNQVYATESSALDPEWMMLATRMLIDADKPNLMPLDAETYPREFLEDEPFTHPSTDEE